MFLASKLRKLKQRLEDPTLPDSIRKYHLDPLTDTGIDPNDLLNLTQINSTYIEIVDTGYQWLGVLSSICVPLTAWFIYLFVERIHVHMNSEIDFWFWANLALDMLFLPILLLLSGVMAWSDFFKFTHYPVRLNRKNRMVYVFRINGTILSAPWDEVFFARTPNNAGMYGSAFLKGYWLEKDGKSLREQFSFGTQCEDDEGALAQWEFIRRYMESGPKDLIDRVMFCMPVDRKKESYLTGLERISCHFGGFIRILMLPFSIYVSLWRWLAMRTHKIPVWSKEVEDACVIDPNDPYVKDYRINPKELQ